jgi:hypothetical protein
MSRAFRDTFKQTFCFPYQKFDHQESASLCTQPLTSKKRQHQLTPSVTYEHTPPLQNVNHSTTTPLLNESQSNGIPKKSSFSSP